jgi:hypothetical protein
MGALVADAARDVETTDTGTDANDNVMTFDAIVAPEDAARGMDAPEPALDAEPIDGGSVVAPDAVVIDLTRDGGMDAPDPFASRDAAPDARVAGDTGACTGASSCPVATINIAPSLVSCQDTTCVSGACTRTGEAMECPPAGMCARACERSLDTGLPVCRREGMRCASIGDACDSDWMCTSGNVCEVLSGCRVGVCVPGCSSVMVGRTMSYSLPPLGVVTATCNGHGYTPADVVLPWCATAVAP